MIGDSIGRNSQQSNHQSNHLRFWGMWLSLWFDCQSNQTIKSKRLKVIVIVIWLSIKSTNQIKKAQNLLWYPIIFLGFDTFNWVFDWLIWLQSSTKSFQWVSYMIWLVIWFDSNQLEKSVIWLMIWLEAWLIWLDNFFLIWLVILPNYDYNRCRLVPQHIYLIINH